MTNVIETFIIIIIIAIITVITFESLLLLSLL